RRLGRPSGTAGAETAARTARSARRTRCSARTTGSRNGARTGRSARSGAWATRSETAGAGAADIHAPDVALAHGGVPGGLDLAILVDGDLAVVDEDEGIRDAADR